MGYGLVWLDPSRESNNQGDRVIADAVSTVFAGLGLHPVLRLSTHRALDWESIRTVADPRFVVGGTNLLNSDHPLRRWWKIAPRDVRRLSHRVVLFGVGWWQYQGRPNVYTRWLYRQALATSIRHSVRDAYTKDKLESFGIPAVNTGCPTTWTLGDRPERSSRRGARVVTTITDYARDPTFDGALITLLNELYDEVWLWPQGAHDEAYVTSLDVRARIMDSGLDVFDATVSVPHFDYVGTRLHAGIRALQLGARSTIIAVDNRAREMSRDLGLPVVDRRLDEAARAVITEPRDLLLHIPRARISAWKRDLQGWLLGEDAPTS